MHGTEQVPSQAVRHKMTGAEACAKDEDSCGGSRGCAGHGARDGRLISVGTSRSDARRGVAAARGRMDARGVGARMGSRDHKIKLKARRARLGPLRGPRLRGLAPSRDPGLGRARVSDLGAAAPKSGGVGLTLWQLLGELQILLACWADACPLCQRPRHAGYVQRGGHQRRLDRRHAAPRVLVFQRPSHVAILHPSHTASGRPIGQASGWVPRRVVVEATLQAA